MSRVRSLENAVVLVVEDDRDSLQTLTCLLGESLGCVVTGALSGREALGMIEAGLAVDLVLSDVVMPDLDGLMLAHEVRKRLPSVPVVLATGWPGVVDKVVERGAIAMIKPYSIEQLEAVLTEQLLIRRAGRRTERLP
jgi:CheY-like chemotaxis protein